MDFGFIQAQLYVAMVAEEGSFSRAARRLRVSQSLVTKRISHVERILGTKLFERTTRHVALTEAGRLLLPDVQVSLRHAERAWNLAQYASRTEGAPIRIGFSSCIHTEMVAGLFSLDLGTALEGGEEPPARKLELSTGDTPELMEQVIRGQLQLGLGVQPIRAPELAVQPLAREAFCLCVPKNHRFAQRPSLAVRELGGEPIFWLSRRTHSAFHASVLEYFKRLDVNTNFREVDSVLHAVNAAAAGLGVALLPSGAAWLSRSGVVFKSLTDRFLQAETAMFWRRDSRSEILDRLTAFLSFRLGRLQTVQDPSK